MNGLWLQPVNAAGTLGSQDHGGLTGLVHLDNEGFQLVAVGLLDDLISVVDEEQTRWASRRMGEGCRGCLQFLGEVLVSGIDEPCHPTHHGGPLGEETAARPHLTVVDGKSSPGSQQHGRDRAR